MPPGTQSVKTLRDIGGLSLNDARCVLAVLIGKHLKLNSWALALEKTLFLTPRFQVKEILAKYPVSSANMTYEGKDVPMASEIRIKVGHKSRRTRVNRRANLFTLLLENGDIRSVEAINALLSIAHRAQVLNPRHFLDKRHLQPVRILELVNHDQLESALILTRDCRAFLQKRQRAMQQAVVIKRARLI